MVGEGEKTRNSRDGCPLHNRHIPIPHTLVPYYILPSKYGGTETPENTVLVCPNGHANTTLLLGLSLLAGTMDKSMKLAVYAVGERALAKRSFEAITAVRRQAADG